MKIQRFLAFSLLIIINLSIFSFLFYTIYLILPKNAQRTFQESFEQQQKFITKSIRKITKMGQRYKTEKQEEEYVKKKIPFLNKVFLKVFMSIWRFIRSIISLFLSFFYALKAVIKLIYQSFKSTIRYLIDELFIFDEVLTQYTTKIIKLATKIFRFLAFGPMWIIYKIQLFLYKRIPDDIA